MIPRRDAIDILLLVYKTGEKKGEDDYVLDIAGRSTWLGAVGQRILYIETPEWRLEYDFAVPKDETASEEHITRWMDGETGHLHVEGDKDAAMRDLIYAKMMRND